MASGMQILGGLLGGLGGFGTQVGGAMEDQRKEQIRLDALQQAKDQAAATLAENVRQFDVGRTDKVLQPSQYATFLKHIGVNDATVPTEAVPLALAEKMATVAMARQEHELKRQDAAAKLTREQGVNTRTQAFMRGAQEQPGTPAVLPPDEGAMYDPGVPATEGRPAMGRTEAGAGLAGLGHEGANYKAFMDTLFPEKKAGKFAAAGENSPGAFNTETGAFTSFDRPGQAPQERPADRPGFQWVATQDKNGKVGYREDPIGSGNDRDAMASALGHGSFARAPQNVQVQINQHIDTEGLRRSRAQGADAAGVKPLTGEDAKDIAGHTSTLGAIEQAKGFSPEERARYLGLLNQPLAKGKEMAAGMGLGASDKRFNEFQAVNGRLKSGMFLTAGKALTPMEEKVTSAFIITGDEPNAGAYTEKLKLYEAYTRAQRETQLQMARTPRSRADLEEYDARLTENLRRAGANMGSQAAPAAQPGGGTRVRDPRTGRTGTVPAGQPVPQGLEVVR